MGFLQLEMKQQSLKENYSVVEGKEWWKASGATKVLRKIIQVRSTHTTATDLIIKHCDKMTENNFFSCSI